MSLSFLIHGLLIAAGIGASYWASHKAQEEPAKLTFFAPPPPPPPPPGGGGSKKKSVRREVPKVRKEFVQPKEIPKETPKVEEKKQEDSGDDNAPAGVVGGVVGGVEGGVVGGVVGGVLGGTGTGPLSYERVSRLPGRRSGDEKPPIPGSLLPALRGSKGIILLKIRINREGKVDSVEIVRSTMPMLDDIVRKNAMNWVFDPPMNAGRPVAIEVLQPYSFVF